MYNVKSVFYTIQGEGANAGRAAVFCRFSGCNGWSGRNQDRNNGPFPCSRWCDTDFLDGERIDEDDLIARILSLFPSIGNRLVVFTGGEPALQLTDSLLDRLRPYVPQIAIETNGSRPLPPTADNCWVTVSPKTPNVALNKASELKLIFPTIPPQHFDDFRCVFRFLQPLHNENWQRNTNAAVAYVKAHPLWQLSLQTHKFTGMP